MNKVFLRVFAKWLVGCVVTIFLATCLAVLGLLTGGVSTIVLITAFGLFILYDEYKKALGRDEESK